MPPPQPRCRPARSTRAVSPASAALIDRHVNPWLQHGNKQLCGGTTWGRTAKACKVRGTCCSAAGAAAATAPPCSRAPGSCSSELHAAVSAPAAFMRRSPVSAGDAPRRGASCGASGCCSASCTSPSGGCVQTYRSAGMQQLAAAARRAGRDCCGPRKPQGAITHMSNTCVLPSPVSICTPGGSRCRAHRSR